VDDKHAQKLGKNAGSRAGILPSMGKIRGTLRMAQAGHVRLVNENHNHNRQHRDHDGCGDSNLRALGQAGSLNFLHFRIEDAVARPLFLSVTTKEASSTSPGAGLKLAAYIGWSFARRCSAAASVSSFLQKVKRIWVAPSCGSL
jgi:hypothetical protein